MQGRIDTMHCDVACLTALPVRRWRRLGVRNRALVLLPGICGAVLIASCATRDERTGGAGDLREIKIVKVGIASTNAGWGESVFGVTPGGEYLVTASGPDIDANIIRLRHVKTGEVLARIPRGAASCPSTAYMRVRFDGEGRRFVIPYSIWALGLHERAGVAVFEAMSGQQIGTNLVVDTGDPIGNKVYDVDISRDGRLVCSAGLSGEVLVWNVGEMRQVGRFHADVRDINAVGFSPSGDLLAAAGSNGIAVWDVTTGQLVRRLACSRACRIQACCAKWLALRIDEDQVVAIDLLTAAEVCNVKLPRRADVYDVTITGDGNGIALHTCPRYRTTDGDIWLIDIAANAIVAHGREPGGEQVHGFSVGGRWMWTQEIRGKTDAVARAYGLRRGLLDSVVASDWPVRVYRLDYPDKAQTNSPSARTGTTTVVRTGAK